MPASKRQRHLTPQEVRQIAEADLRGDREELRFYRDEFAHIRYSCSSNRCAKALLAAERQLSKQGTAQSTPRQILRVLITPLKPI